MYTLWYQPCWFDGMLTPGADAIAPYACVSEPEPESVAAAFCPAELIEKTSLVTPEWTSDCAEREVVRAIVLSARCIDRATLADWSATTVIPACDCGS